MHAVLGPLLTDFLGTEVRPCRDDLKEKERIFACEDARTILCKRQRELDIISAHATSCYPPTETKPVKTVVLEKEAKVQEKEEENILTVLKEDILQENNLNDEKWLQPVHTIKLLIKIESSYGEHEHTNRCSVL